MFKLKGSRDGSACADPEIFFGGGGSEGYLCLLGKGERNPRPIFGNIYFVNLKKIKFPEGSKPYPQIPILIRAYVVFMKFNAKNQILHLYLVKANLTHAIMMRVRVIVLYIVSLIAVLVMCSAFFCSLNCNDKIKHQQGLLRIPIL